MGTSTECRTLAVARRGFMAKSTRADAGIPYASRYDDCIDGNLDGMPYASECDDDIIGNFDGILQWYNTNFVT